MRNKSGAVGFVPNTIFKKSGLYFTKKMLTVLAVQFAMSKSTCYPHYLQKVLFSLFGSERTGRWSRVLAVVFYFKVLVRQIKVRYHQDQHP